VDDGLRDLEFPGDLGDPQGARGTAEQEEHVGGTFDRRHAAGWWCVGHRPLAESGGHSVPLTGSLYRSAMNTEEGAQMDNVSTPHYDADLWRGARSRNIVPLKETTFLQPT
jgi:hypothetical protein